MFLPPFRRASHFLIGAIVALSTLAATPAAEAGIRKMMLSCDAGLCPVFLPELRVPQGWQVEEAATKANSILVLVPRGAQFGDAEALIYGRAFVNTKKQTIDQRVKESNTHWLNSVEDAKITRLDDVAPAGDGMAFQLYRYDNPSKDQQSAEIVAFGEDTDKQGNAYGVQVVLTAMTKAGLERNKDVLIKVLSDY